MFAKLSGELIKHGLGDVDMCFFATAEHHFGFDFIPLFKEFLGLLNAGHKVALTNSWGQADAFDFDFFRLGALFAGLLLFLVLKLAEIAKKANWWLGLC